MLNYVNFYIMVSFHLGFIVMLCQRQKEMVCINVRKESQRDSD